MSATPRLRVRHSAPDAAAFALHHAGWVSTIPTPGSAYSFWHREHDADAVITSDGEIQLYGDDDGVARALAVVETVRS